MVHVGVSGIAKEITLEQLAHNDGYDKFDVKGQVPNNNTCVDDGKCPRDACVKSKLCMGKVCQAILEDECKVNAVISHDPGR